MQRNCRRKLVITLLCVIGAALSARAMSVRDALGHFETGATKPTRCAADLKIGGKKEISRFQILPELWRRYSASGNYQDPNVAWNVAERILREREQWFRQASGRDWDAIDLYIMWNAPGQYERAKWDRRKVSRVVLERAQRFANLVEDGERTLVRLRLSE